MDNRFLRFYRAAAVLVLNVVLVVALVELVSATVLHFQSVPRSSENAVYVTAPTLAYYTSRPWGAEFWREFIAAKQEYYSPYVVFRRHRYAGQYVNIDDLGLRVTPDAQCGQGSYVVWMFGGSTLWGTGAPDSLTIPALFQRALAPTLRTPLCVRNFGESAWVSSQELVQLTLALRDGGRPNAVIFYDGVNDVFSAFQTGRAGSHQNEQNVAERFQGSSWMRQALNASSTLALMRVLQARRRVPPARRDPALADSIVARYMGVTNVVRSLGRAYGFRTMFFWQPEIFQSGKTLTARENAIAQDFGSPLTGLYADTYRRMSDTASRSGDIRDVSRVLAGRSGELFLDWAHVLPVANADVAAAMVRAWNTP